MQHNSGRAKVSLFRNHLLFPEKSHVEGWLSFSFESQMLTTRPQIHEDLWTEHWIYWKDNFKWSFSALSNFKPLKFVGNPLIIKNVNKSKWQQMEFHICWGRLPGLFCHRFSCFCLLKWNVSLSRYEDRLQPSDILKRNQSDPRCGTRGPICVVHNDLSPKPFPCVETQVINPG